MSARNATRSRLLLLILLVLGVLLWRATPVPAASNTALLRSSSAA